MGARRGSTVMNVRRKLRLLLIFLLVLMVCTLFTVREWRNAHLAAQQENREREVSVLFDEILALDGHSLFSFSTDYTYWDDLVEFLKTGGDAWGDENLAAPFSTFGAQACWVLRLDGSTVYRHVEIEGLGDEALPLSGLSAFFGAGNRLTHFFLKTGAGFAEFYGATIHPTDDPERKTPPQGYFLVCRVWDGPLLERLGKLIRGQTEVLEAIGDTVVIPEQTLADGSLMLQRPLRGLDGSAVAVLTARISSPLLQTFLDVTSLGYLAATLMLVSFAVVFGIVMIRSIDLPLKNLAKGLAEGTSAPLEALARQENEFGHLARMIQQGFEQKAELVREVEERERAEAALRKNEERVRKYFELPLIGFAMLSKDGHWIEVNGKLCSILGYSREELLGLRWQDVTVPEDRHRQMAVYHEILEGACDGYTIQKRYIRRDGSLINVETSAMCVRDVAGQVDYFVAVIEDITERKRAEDALQFTQFAVDHAAEGMFWIRRDGRFYRVNDAGCRMFGYPREDVLQMSVADVLPLYSRERWETVWQSLRETDTVVRESMARSRDGREFPIEAIINRLAFKGEEFVFVFTRDISERKQAEKERAELAEQLRQAQKMESIGRLAGGVAHDFNNFLSPIIGYADLVLGQMAPREKYYDEVKQILDAAERCSTLTRQLLVFSRKQVLHVRTLDMNEVIRGFEKMLRRLIGEDVELVTRLEDDLLPVKADPSQLEQVLMNLAVNSRDAMPQGGQLTIETAMVELDALFARTHRGVEPGTYVMFSVSDTGVGMPPEVMERIFEPFFTTKERGKGTGLGLATIYGIVQQHGGSIWVYSEPGCGTVFKIYLPAFVGEAEQEQVSEPVPYLTAGGTETLLIVEDEEAVRKLVGDVLVAYGYTIHLAASPAEAMALAADRNLHIDLLLTDVILPQMNGKDLYSRLAVERPDMRVLFMSGYTGNTMLAQGIGRDKFDLLQKPFSVQALTSRVRQALEKKVVA